MLVFCMSNLQLLLATNLWTNGLPLSKQIPSLCVASADGLSIKVTSIVVLLSALILDEPQPMFIFVFSITLPKLIANPTIYPNSSLITSYLITTSTPFLRHSLCRLFAEICTVSITYFWEVWYIQSISYPDCIFELIF